MDTKTINEKIETIENNLEIIKTQIQIFENQKRIENKKKDDSKNPAKMEKARLMKFIYAEISKGSNSWETAEKVKDFFPSVWDAYYFITHFLREEKARKRYALFFLVHCLSDNGFSNVEISKIAGYSPQRCGQILKISEFSS